MSFLPLVFWLALLLPGYALVRRYWPEEVKSGLLGTIGLSYVLVVGALSVVSLVGYWMRLPLMVLSGACVVAVVAGLEELIRRGWWRDLGRLLLAGVCVEMLIVAGDMVLGARVGAYMGGDATLHVARIRFLLDNGLSNIDPYVGCHFYPVYHTNITHALHAACAQLTGADQFAVWHLGLVWSKLLIASAMYYLTWTVFRSQWAAWVATMFTVGAHAPVTFISYPNKLAALWLWTIGLAFIIQACQRPTWKAAVKLACVALLLGQTHALYGAFALVLAGPVFAIALLWCTWCAAADRHWV